MAGLLVFGLAANALVRPLAQHQFTEPAELVALNDTFVQAGPDGSQGIGRDGLSLIVAAAWIGVLLPITWGLYMTLSKVSGLL